MITPKFKKFFKKANSKKKNFSKLKNSDREHFSECFKCGKLDHIVKNCLLLKEEEEAKQSRKQGKKQAGNNSGRRFSMQCLWLGEIQPRRMKGLRKRMQQ